MSGMTRIKRVTGGLAGPSVVVGLHRVAMFPSDNLHGAHRWVAVLEDQAGEWYRHILRGHKPAIGEWLP